MGLIDRYVRTLFDQGADGVGIAVGHPVMLIQSTERKPLSAGALDEAGVTLIVNEVLSDDHKATLDRLAQVDVQHDTAHGSVKVSVKRLSGSLRIMITRAASGGARSSEGAAVRSSEGAAVRSSEGAAVRSSEGAAVRTGEHMAVRSSEGASRLSPSSAVQVVPATRPSTSPPSPSTSSTASLQAQKGERPIDPLFRQLVQKGGSDLYICTGKKPMIRKDGDLVPIANNEMNEDEVKRLLFSCAPNDMQEELARTNDVDFAYEILGLARFRANLFRDRMGLGGIFRQIPVEILTAEKLGLPPSVLELCTLNKGLVLVTGPTGSGKSTTLAAMIDYINRTRSAHIITIEDPIEFVHPDKRCVINQREVGNHTQGFKRALRAALREDPDIVLVGEMRDLETVAIAIETAETGHLVFGTLHTNTAASTVDRIIDQFPAEQQQQIRTMLAEALKGVISQTLCKKKGGGRVAALEILLVPHAVSNLIREAKTHQLASTMQTSRASGMVTLNDALMDLVDQKLIVPEEAWAKAVDKSDLKAKLQRANIFIPGT